VIGRQPACARGWWSGRACSLCHFPSYAEDIRNDPVKVPEYRLESSPARIGMNS